MNPEEGSPGFYPKHTGVHSNRVINTYVADEFIPHVR